MLGRRQFLTGAAALAAAPASLAQAQQKTELIVSRQPGILYMALHVIEKQKLLEKHAEKQGVAGPSVKWVSFANGGAQQDALLSGGVDVVNTGTGNMLLLWDRTKGGVKGIVASTAARLTLVSRDPRIKTLADYQATDRIAVPTVKVSTQAILLQMAAAKMFGADKFGHFDPMTVQMGHPDAFVAMKNSMHEVRNHFAAPPFDFYEQKQIEGAHVVTDSAAIIGGQLTQGQFFTRKGSSSRRRNSPTPIRSGSPPCARRRKRRRRSSCPIPKKRSRPTRKSTTTRRRRPFWSNSSRLRRWPTGASIRRAR